MLPDDSDERVPTDPVEPPDQRPRVVREPREEFQIKLANVKKDVDPIINDFPMDLPEKNVAIKLSKLLRELADATGRYQKWEKKGRRKILEDFRDATVGAAIAAKLLTKKDELSIDKMKEIFKHLEQFQHKLERCPTDLQAYK